MSMLPQGSLAFHDHCGAQTLSTCWLEATIDVQSHTLHAELLQRQDVSDVLSLLLEHVDIMSELLPDMIRTPILSLSPAITDIKLDMEPTQSTVLLLTDTYK